LASDLEPQRKRELLLTLASREALQAAVEEDLVKRESAIAVATTQGRVTV
jgi:hypothetical protein